MAGLTEELTLFIRYAISQKSTHPILFRFQIYFCYQKRKKENLKEERKKKKKLKMVLKL